MSDPHPPEDTQALLAQAERPKLNRSGDRRGIKHGYKFTRTYRLWCKMKERCSNHNAINYERYGGRGITVCPEWQSDFPSFLRDMGECPSAEHSLERKNNSEGYSKGNCVWATRIEQANNKRNNVFVEFAGQTKSVAAWCRELGLNYPIVRQRIYRDGWTAERAFTT